MPTAKQLAKGIFLVIVGIAIAGFGYFFATGTLDRLFGGESPEEELFVPPEFDNENAVAYVVPAELDWPETLIDPFNDFSARISLPEGYSLRTDGVIPEQGLAMYLVYKEDTGVTEEIYTTQMQVVVTKKPETIPEGTKVTSILINHRRGFMFKTAIPLPPEQGALASESSDNTFDIILTDFTGGYYVHLYAVASDQNGYEDLLRIATTLR